MENYQIVLDALAEKIKHLQNDDYIKDIQIDALKKKLAEVEKYLDTIPAKAKKLEIR